MSIALDGLQGRSGTVPLPKSVVDLNQHMVADATERSPRKGKQELCGSGFGPTAQKVESSNPVTTKLLTVSQVGLNVFVFSMSSLVN